MVKFFDNAQTMEPTVEKVRATRRGGRRPHRWDKATKFGCQTIEVRRNEVRTQKASIVLPLSATVMSLRKPTGELAVMGEMPDLPAVLQR